MPDTTFYPPAHTGPAFATGETPPAKITSSAELPAGDLADAAREYLRAGFVLVPIPSGTKGPTTPGWNRRENCITRDAQLSRIGNGNVGLALAYSGFCAIDIDGPKARAFFARHAVDIDAMLNAPDAVRIDSGRPGRAKLLYRVPEGTTLINVRFRHRVRA